jgi:hypothetical protein
MDNTLAQLVEALFAKAVENRELKEKVKALELELAKKD